MQNRRLFTFPTLKLYLSCLKAMCQFSLSLVLWWMMCPEWRNKGSRLFTYLRCLAHSQITYGWLWCSRSAFWEDSPQSIKHRDLYLGMSKQVQRPLKIQIKYCITTKRSYREEDWIQVQVLNHINIATLETSLYFWALA